jgi:hypothetical protein
MTVSSPSMIFSPGRRVMMSIGQFLLGSCGVGSGATPGRVAC